MRDHELKVLVLRREMEAAGLVGGFARHNMFESSLISPFLMLICDPATPSATLAPAAGRLRGVTTFATTFFPGFSSKSIAMVPSLLLMSRETAA